MAEIHLARAVGIEGFEKLVVLKRILPQYADNEEFVQMFLDEARLAATLHHSNVVQVFDIGCVDGQYFLAMEFLHGQDGRQLMKAVTSAGKLLPLENALAIMVGVCAGLHYAHTRVVDGKPLNLVHRDISPQNVFITYDGGVKLLDFGIARASSRLNETRGGTLKGKIAYMSPEQCAGLPLDQRSDVFAAAIILWEMTTGRRLFTGESDFEILRKIKEEDAPRPSTVGFAYPLALERIVLTGLKRNRDERYATAEEMQVELEAFVREQRLAVSPVMLSRFMREQFSGAISAWHSAERGGQAIGDYFAQPTPSGVSHTETSIPPPLFGVDRSLAPGGGRLQQYIPPAAPEPRRKRGLIAAIALGVVAGSVATWMVARRPSTAPSPSMVQPAAPRQSSPSVVPPPIAPPAHEAQPAVGARPAPSTSQSASHADSAGATSPPDPPQTAVATHGDATPAKKAPLHRAPPKKAAPKKLPNNWDPESMLPP